MAFEGNLGEISLASESVKKEDLHTDVMKVEKLDADTKKELEEKLLKSDAGEKLNNILKELTKKETGEQKKEALVDLLKKFFDEDADNNALKRLVVDGKTYVRLDMGDDIFDIELTDALMPSLIDFYIEKTTAIVNEGITDEKEQVKINYKELVIKQTQAELAALQNNVLAPKKDFRSRDEFKKDPSGRVKGFGPRVKDTVKSFKDFFDELPTLGTTIKDAFGGIKTMFKK